MIEELLSIIGNAEYKVILKRDFDELISCYENKANKSTVILSGSILEAILLEFLTSTASSEQEVKKVKRKTLQQLIDKAHDIELISENAKNLSSVVRDYRNYVHPDKEVRTQNPINEETASIAFSLLKMIVNEISENYDKLSGITAESIYTKFKKDSSSILVFENLVLSANFIERAKLLDLFVEYIGGLEYGDSHAEKSAIDHLEILKIHLDSSSILKYLVKLKHEVQFGSQHTADFYFSLFGNSVNLFSDKDREFVVIYMLNSIEKPNHSEVRLAQILRSHRIPIIAENADNELIASELTDFVCNYASSVPSTGNLDTYLFSLLNLIFKKQPKIEKQIFDKLATNLPNDDYQRIVTNWNN